MSIQVKVILDSGCFLPIQKPGTSCEVGYYQCDPSTSDIRVYLDGDEASYSYPSDPFKLGGGNCTVEIRHKMKDGSINKDGVKKSPTCHGRLLHMNRDLYGEDLAPDRTKFDCVLHFDSGRFCDSKVKKRRFKEHSQQPDGTYVYTTTDQIKEIGPVAHDVVVHYKLDDGEAIELARDGRVFWSSEKLKIEGLLEIELIADNSTVEKFYCKSFKVEKDKYWVPNQGDPPPVCPEPPCIENGG